MGAFEQKICICHYTLIYSYPSCSDAEKVQWTFILFFLVEVTKKSH